MSGEQESGSPAGERSEAPAGAGAEHLNIKVTDNNNEVFFKIKRSTKLEKLMNAFCERQGKSLTSVRFLFEGQRVQPTDTPDTVSCITFTLRKRRFNLLELLDQARSPANG
jgi:small ubiquitin-related modifier